MRSGSGIVRTVRYVVPIAAVLAIVAALALVKGTQISTLVKAGRAAEAAGPPPVTVGSGVAREETWDSTLSAVGSVETVKGVALSLEVPGVVSAIRFESGKVVKKGDLLLELEAKVEKAQLAAARARKQLAQQTYDRNRALVETGTLAAAQLDSDEASLETATADIGALEAQIARKTLRAPFDGKLGIRAVNLGQYLAPGTMVTVLETADTQYVDFTRPQDRLGEVAAGTAVRITLEGQPGPPLDGTISAIDPTVDPVTRALRLRASAPDPAKSLRPGMFVRVEVVLPKKQQVVVVPLTAVMRATYGDSVFVIEPAPSGQPGKIARQQFVRTGEARGDFVAIEEGVAPGQQVVVAGGFKLKNGARVTIDDSDQPTPSIAPKVENR